MSNQEIIIGEIISNGIYTQEEVEAFLAKGIEPPVHTYQRWKELGYRVRAGSRAKIKTRLWKHKTDKNKDSAETDKNEVEVADNSGFFLAPAYLFTLDQVDRYMEVTK